MKYKKHYFLMISCPSDVIKERNLLEECVKQINKERTDDVWVELQYWVTDTSSDAGMQAQDSINEQIVNDSDGLIAIFNARLGTPVHEYKCGTDEEIALMLKANKHVSLLFNTRPTIDLSNPQSIEQITKLQEYKNEQSQKAYYREFSDEDSFTVLARREILLWLRKIINDNTEIIKLSDKQQTTDNNNQVKEEPVSSGNAEVTETVEIVKPNTEQTIDEEAGAFDCVYFIIGATEEITNEINNFGDYCNLLNENTTIFNDKVNMLRKQNNGNSGMLLACQKFAGEIDEHNTKVNSVIGNIEVKWNEIYNYLLILNKNDDVSNEDKIIINDSVSSLKECFEQSVPEIDEFLETISSIPNFQKSIKKAINNTTTIYKRLKSLMIKIIENCEEIDGLCL